MRTNTAKAKPTIIDAKTGKIDPNATHSSTWQDRVEAKAAEIDQLSFKRVIATWVLSVAAGVSSYIAGQTIVTYLTYGTLMLTGSGFIAMVVYLLGLILNVYASFNAFSLSFNYMTSAKCTQHLALVSASVDSANAKVAGWFKRTPKPEAA